MGTKEEELKYSSAFLFKKLINTKFHDDLGDYLYKFAFNLQEAHEYVSIFLECYDIEIEYRTVLINRIHIMSLQCYALSIRKMTDYSSERSLRKLKQLLPSTSAVIEYSTTIDSIYKHYEKFLNKFVVHQDTISISNALELIPNKKVILEDLQALREYYLTLCREICTGFIGIDEDGTYFGVEIEKLLN